ncbi:MAG: hypothetical protein EXR92_07600, partial [Gemmatimonadetes bacterium]|nr:hypothetical protein [Gemmatimonadota bacterium]
DTDYTTVMARSTDPEGTDGSGSRPSGGERFPKFLRIRLGGDIRTLLRSGKRRRDPILEVFSAPSVRPGTPRFGVVVPRHGHTIAERNLLRRRLREIGRREVLPHLAQEGCHADVLVRSRREAYDAAFPALREALIRCTERLCSDRSSSA